MQTVTLSQPSPQDCILTKIDQVYHHHRNHCQLQQQQAAVRQRRQLVQARAAFQRELNRALTQQTQVGLNIQISVDGPYRNYPNFVATFEFQGQVWHLRCQHRLWGCDWFIKTVGSVQITRCTRRTLEAQLYFALGQRRNQMLGAMSHLLNCDIRQPRQLTECGAITTCGPI